MKWNAHPRLQQCAAALAGGGVIAYPTEGVWGLGCDPFNVFAVQRVLDLKKRKADKGLILVAGHISQFNFLLHDLDAENLARLKDTWPGHVTWLVPHHERIPEIVCGQFDTIALRVSAHPLVQALCRGFGGPIVSTSANPQGLPPARNALKVRCYFGEADILLAPSAPATHSGPSKIFDLRSGRQLR